MEFYTFTLPNGIRCIHKKIKSPAVHCAMTINTGSRDELPGEHGMAHLVEHMLFKGTQKRKAYHVNCRLENLGGELNAYTTKEETILHATTLRSDFGKAAELISDIIFMSSFPERELQKEKEIIIDEINSYKDSPSELIFDEFEDLLFAGTALGHNILGDKKAVNRYTRDSLSDFTGRTYNTDQMVFSAIGNISEKSFERLVRREFERRPQSPRIFSRDRVGDYVKFEKSVSRNTFQAHCIIGGRAYGLEDQRRIALSLLVNILGGPAANSMLNMSIREKYGLSYNIEAGYSPLSGTGLATIYFSCDHDKNEKCVELVNKQIDRLVKEPMGSRQLSMAKKQFLAQLAISMENNESLILGAAKSLLVYNQIDEMPVIYRKIKSVSASEIVDVAREIFTDTSMLLYR